ncbi:hypothetical protein EKO04_003158 [Ascochyta lentis]|uniref:Telomere replication protein EST3 n=1 Tax=Ascochyta lentis TaxID=205686 RepID=A0A8H7J869_9PLEO|nr:hypothetical protein EKO04_003158 [Ascochyta lentis]
MAVSPTAWLHEEVKTQLELGNAWLADKNRANAALARPSTIVDTRWEGIYHDNGSCIDIVGPISAHHVHLLVLKTSPLTVTDGRHQTELFLTTTCLHDLRTRFPSRDIVIGTILAVRKYTIRYTSYGPPRDKFRLLLHTADWVEEGHRTHSWPVPVQSLLHSQDIAAALQRLHRTRVHQDRRCLRPAPKEEEDCDGESFTMAGAHESLDEDPSMNTQMPFGTQVQHPIRPRRDDEEPQFVGINRLEPVLAGNTKRADLKPRSGGSITEASATEKQKQAQLLSLLYQNRGPVAPQVQTGDHIDPRPRPRETPEKWAARERTEGIVAQSPTQVQTPPEKGKKRMREVDMVSPSTHHSAKKTAFSETETKQSNVNEMERFAAECSWMKGLKFNRESSIVPEDQARILSKPESWHKPQPGLRFPEANIPMQTFITLSRLQDEKIASEGALEASSGPYNETDPSPASYPPTSAPQLEDEQEEDSEDETPTSPVTWTASPTPEPPQRPATSHQYLPPDSSNEVPADVTAPAMPHRSATTEHQSPQPSLLPSSDEREVAAPPSSPPGPQATKDSDDEMELETAVPQALGEDLETHPTSRSTQEPRSRSVVLVKETPHVKGKNGQPVVTISPPTQSSNDYQHESSSTSVVRGTYHDFTSSAVEETNLDVLRRDNNRIQQNSNLSVQVDGVHTLLHDPDAQDVSMFDMSVNDGRLLDSTEQQGVQKKTHGKQTEMVEEDTPAQPEPTPMSAQLPPKDSSSGEQAASGPVESASVMPVRPERELSRQPSATPSLTKRKRETTSIKDKKRPSGSKRLKIVSFGNRDNEQRAELLRRTETERRKSSTSIESRQGSVSSLPIQQDADTTTEVSNAKETAKPQVDEVSVVAEGDMSPRHQSLYAAPSPILRPSVSSSGTAPAAKTMDGFHTEPHAPGNNVTHQISSEEPVQPQQGSQPKPQAAPEAEQHTVPVQLPEPRIQSEATQPSLEFGARTEQTPPAASISAARRSKVFEIFKQAYPEYGGEVEHFKNLCSQIELLDRDDKMVPKWMWDDYIIRNRADYKVYMVECIESGEPTVSYNRFYKDTIRDTIYKKGVIETRATLLRALQELEIQPFIDEAPAPRPRLQQAVQRSNDQSPRSSVQQPASARQSHQHPVQHPRRQSTQQFVQSPMPPPVLSATTPPKKPSRKSLPFGPPSTHVNATPHVRHSLPASSSRATPVSTPSASAQQRSRTRPKSKSRFAETLKSYQESDDPPILARDEFREFSRSQAAMTSVTGSTRVDATKPWPRNLEVRPSVKDLPKKKVDVLSWRDDL